MIQIESSNPFNPEKDVFVDFNDETRKPSSRKRNDSVHIIESRTRSSYDNPLTGEIIEIPQNRKMEKKETHDNISGLNNFFTTVSSVDWVSMDSVPGNNKVS